MASQPVQSTIAPGVNGAISQFFGFTQACGEAAAEILYSATRGVAPSGAHINAAVSGLQGAGLAGAQGVSTLGGNAWALAQEGVATQQTSDWVGAITRNAGQIPVMIGVSNGGALPGDEPGLHNHFLSIVGYDSAGRYLASDPDNVAAQSGKLAAYTPAELAAAHPFGALIPSGALSAPAPGWTHGPALPAFGSAGKSAGNAAGNAAGDAGNWFLKWLGLPTATQFFWRAGLVIGGALLVLIGLGMFFSHSQAGQTVIETVRSGASTAAKAAAVAA
jgi:hypothetical protein